MQENALEFPWRKVILTIFAIAAWVSIPVIGYVDANRHDNSVQCPNGPLMADLVATATANSNKAPSGTAQFRERNNNGLMVKVRNISAAQGTTLTVYIGDTQVGTFSLPRNGNGQLKLDTVSPAINEGTIITVRNGTDTILTGTFRCVAGSGNKNRNTNGNTAGNENVNGNANGNTNSNMNVNMDMNGNANANTNSNANVNANTNATPRRRGTPQP